MGDELSEAARAGIYETIFKRRDIRAFRGAPVPADILARILRAAHHAPSVGYMQPWSFMVIQDPQVRERVHNHVDVERIRAADGFTGKRRGEYLSLKLEGIREAPINLCITCDSERAGNAVIGRNTLPEMDVYSVCCAVQNLWLAARAEGIGVGWVSICQAKRMREILGIPEAITIVAYLCVGYAKAFYNEPELETAGWRKRLPLPDLIFGDTWQSPAPDELIEALRETE